jgi:NADPH-dependent curcumin reductase CurA
MGEVTGAGVTRRAVVLGELHAAFEHLQPHVLMDLVLLQILAGAQGDQHESRDLVHGLQHDRVLRLGPVLGQLPEVHGTGHALFGRQATAGRFYSGRRGQRVVPDGRGATIRPMSTPSREIQLAARPHGAPQSSDFRLAEVEVPDPGPGEVLIRNTFMSVDPYMRGRMNAGKSYVPRFEIDAPLDGGAVGEVVASDADGLAPGDTVVHSRGWREHAVVPGKHARKVDVSELSPSLYLGALGMPGITAYAGLLDVAGLREGDVVFVSGAAGAVGSLAGQIAKLRGNTVIGSAGSAEKVAHLTDDLGFDAAFNYKEAPVAEQLKAAAPEGIDVYFDNVGGDHLEAALGALNRHGRVALCGAISAYNATEPAPAPRNLGLAIGKRLTLRGFISSDHADRLPDLHAEVGPALRDGRIAYRETVVEGLENAPQAFMDMLAGANTGKMVVKL